MDALAAALADERRSARLVIRLSRSDAAALEAKAAAAGLSKAEACRALVRHALRSEGELAAA